MEFVSLIERYEAIHCFAVFRDKKEKEFEMYLRRIMNRFNKDVQEDTHKVCLYAFWFSCTLTVRLGLFKHVWKKEIAANVSRYHPDK